MVTVVMREMSVMITMAVTNAFFVRMMSLPSMITVMLFLAMISPVVISRAIDYHVSLLTPTLRVNISSQTDDHHDDHQRKKSSCCSHFTWD
jgi:hypothetical protein